MIHNEWWRERSPVPTSSKWQRWRTALNPDYSPRGGRFPGKDPAKGSRTRAYTGYSSAPRVSPCAGPRAYAYAHVMPAMRCTPFDGDNTLEFLPSSNAAMGDLFGEARHRWPTVTDQVAPTQSNFLPFRTCGAEGGTFEQRLSTGQKRRRA